MKFTELRLVALALAMVIYTCQGFFPGASPMRVARQSVITMGGRKATPLGRVSTPDGKKVKVEQVKERLEDSMLIFSVPSAGISVKQMAELRQKMPESTKIMVVKNTLMNLACEDSSWHTVSELLTKENMWFFVGEEIRETVDGYDDWIKSCGGSFKENFPIKGGIAEGSVLNPEGVRAMSKLPTKQELIAKIAGAIQQAGPQGLVTKIANVKGNPKGLAIRLKQASGQKLVNAIKLALTDPEKNPNA